MGIQPEEANISGASFAANRAVIVGDLVTTPESRTLPSGGQLISFSLTVRLDGVASTSVPMVWYDPPSRTSRWRAGEAIVAAGSVVRRFYQAGGSVGSRTEVTVSHAHQARFKAARQIVVREVAALQDLAELLE